MMTPMLSNPPRATNMTSGGLLVFVSVWSTRTCHVRLSIAVRRTNSGHSDRGRGVELVLPRSITCVAHARHSSAVPARLVRSTSPWTESEQLAQARARTTTRPDVRNFIARPISPNGGTQPRRSEDSSKPATSRQIPGASGVGCSDLVKRRPIWHTMER